MKNINLWTKFVYGILPHKIKKIKFAFVVRLFKDRIVAPINIENHNLPHSKNKSGIFKYWHIELIDDINTYLICFPYTNAMFQKIILKLITTETYEDIQITPYRDNIPYLRKEHSKARVYSNGKELDMM